MKTKQSIELTRYDVTPAQFLAYVRAQLKRKGMRDISSDLDLKYFEAGNDLNFYYHDDPEMPCKVEKSVSHPYEMQTYVLNWDGSSYNEICEFDFDDETTGHGYYYLCNVTVEQAEEANQTEEAQQNQQTANDQQTEMEEKKMFFVNTDKVKCNGAKFEGYFYTVDVTDGRNIASFVSDGANHIDFSHLGSVTDGNGVKYIRDEGHKMYMMPTWYKGGDIAEQEAQVLDFIDKVLSKAIKVVFAEGEGSLFYMV